MKLNQTIGKPLLLIICIFCMAVMVGWTIWTEKWSPSTCIVFKNRNNSIEKSVIRETVMTGDDISHTNDTKYILLWTSFFDSKNWELQADVLDQQYFDRIRCNINNCIITSNRELLPSTLDYDALLFHAALPWKDLGQIPKQRNVHQSYVMAILESPIHTRHDLRDDRDFFNMTMTYRLDSDVLWSYYGAFVDLKTGEQVAPLPGGRMPIWRTPDKNFFDQSIFDQVTKKTKMGAWFASNCNVPSRRDNLVRGLQHYFPVDVYGRCGRFKCPRLSNHCNEILDKDYKFYMSFENSLCEDYVTEKFFATMKRLIVPIVYGGADYSLFAPPYSYIDANDFASVQDLAEYLMFLDRNPKEYVKYFWWKQFYRIEEPTPYCDLCQQLHKTAERGERQHYRDIHNWWSTNRCTSKARIKF